MGVVLGRLYSKWMYAWETRLTNEDSNRVVRPVEWGFDWLADFDSRAAELAARERGEAGPPLTAAEAETEMVALNARIDADSEKFFGYQTPTDFHLERRYPQLFPTNVRPRTLANDAEWKRKAEAGEIAPVEFLRFTSPVRTPYPENDRVNARWFPAAPAKQAGRPRQAMIVMPQWNADAFSHNALCTIFNKFGVSGLRLSKPYHDIRRPPHLQRSDYTMSSNVGRTLAATRQAVIDIRCCVDWLTLQGYEHIGVLGTSLGSCYGFLASAHDPRLEVNVFNHASTWVGDVVWQGQSTRHVRAGFEQAGFVGEAGRQRLRELWRCISPPQHLARYAAQRNHGRSKQTRVIYAEYDLTFPKELSLDVIEGFRKAGLDFDYRVLPCGHYTTGETPFQYLDGWWLASYVYKAFKRLGT